MENPKRIWDDTYRVMWHESATGNRATLVTICNYLQETATRHANHLGFGYRASGEHNLLWVIVRLLVKMDRYPEWDETVTVRTWPRGIEGLFALRDYLIFDSHGNRLGAGSSQWFTIDKETRKPKAPSIVRDMLPLVIPEPALEEQPGKIIISGPSKEIATIHAGYTDLDANHHVNNTRYIDWVLNLVPSEIHETKFLRSFRIEFLAETRIGEEIKIFANDPPDYSLFRGVRPADDKQIFRARIGWE
jgi:medium-chain acyl-[acyl-carrier-protein] hydrolase